MPSKTPNNHATRFKPQDNVAKVRVQPIGAKLPEELDKIVRALPNRSAFVRRAITNQMISEGMVSSEFVAKVLPPDSPEVAIDPPADPVAIDPTPEPTTKKPRGRKPKSQKAGLPDNQQTR